MTGLKRFALIALVLTAAACGTVRGVGQDVQAAGRAVEDAARKTSQAISN